MPPSDYQRHLDKQFEQDQITAKKQQHLQAREAARQQREQEKAAADAEKAAFIAAKTEKEHAIRAAGQTTYTTADGQVHAKPVNPATAAKAAQDKARKQEALDYKLQGVETTPNPVTGAPLALQTEEQAAELRRQKAAQSLAKRDAQQAEQIKAEVELRKAERPPLARDSTTGRPQLELDDKAGLPALRQQAHSALLDRLARQSAEKTGTDDYIPFNEASTPAAEDAASKLARLQTPDDLTDDDLAELEADDATKPIVAKIRQIRDAIAQDDEDDQFYKDRNTQLKALNLKAASPEKYAAWQRQRRAQMAPDELEAELETEAADLEARQIAIEQRATELSATAQAHDVELATLTQQAAERRARGIPAGEVVTYQQEDGTVEHWPADLATQREAIQHRALETHLQQQDARAEIDVEIDRFQADADLHNESRALLQSKAQTQQTEQKQAQQNDRAAASNRLRFSPGMEQTADEFEAIQSEADLRAQDLADMHPDGVPEEAQKALQDDIQQRQQASLAAGQQRQQAAAAAYQGLQAALAPDKDGNAKADMEVRPTVIANLAEALQVDPQEAERLLTSMEILNWDAPSEQDSALKTPADRAAAIQAAKDAQSVGGFVAAMAQTAQDIWNDKPTDPRKTRLLPNGAVVVNPTITSEKDYTAAVNAATATPEAKAEAISRFPEIRQNAGAQVRQSFQELEGVYGKEWVKDWLDYDAKRPQDVSPEEWAMRFTENRKNDSALRRVGQEIGWSFYKGGNQLRQQVSGLVGGITGSETAMQDATWAGRKSQAMQTSKELYGSASDNFLRAGLLEMTPEVATSIIPAAGGAKLAQLGIRGLAATGAGARLFPALAAVLEGSSTAAQAVKATQTLTRAGLAGASLAGGAQTYGAQISDIYGNLRRQGLEHTDALRMAQTPAILSAGVTAALTALGGASGVERLLVNPASAKALFAKQFETQMKRLGFVGQKFVEGGLREFALEELPDEIFSTWQAGVAGNPNDPNAGRKALAEFLKTLPEFAVATGILGGAGEGISSYQESSVLPARHLRPETTATAWSAIENHRARDAQGVVDSNVTALEQQRATTALYLAQGGDISAVEEGDLNAVGYTRDGTKYKPLKDYAGPKMLDIDTGGMPVIKDAYVKALSEHPTLAPVAKAIGMTETETRNFYASRNTATPQPSATPAGQAPAANPVPNANSSPVQTPPVAGTQSPPSGQPPAQSGTPVNPSPTTANDSQPPQTSPSDAPTTPAEFLANHLTQRGLPADQALASAREITARPEFAGMSYEQIIAEGPKFRAALDELGIDGSLNSKDVATNPLKVQPGSKIAKVKAEMEAKAAAAVSQNPSSQQQAKTAAHVAKVRSALGHENNGKLWDTYLEKVRLWARRNPAKAKAILEDSTQVRMAVVGGTTDPARNTTARGDIDLVFDDNIADPDVRNAVSDLQTGTVSPTHQPMMAPLDNNAAAGMPDASNTRVDAKDAILSVLADELSTQNTTPAKSSSAASQPPSPPVSKSPSLPPAVQTALDDAIPGTPSQAVFAAVKAAVKAKEMTEQQAAEIVAQQSGAKDHTELRQSLENKLGWNTTRANTAAALHFGDKTKSDIPLAAAPKGKNTPATDPSAGRMGPEPEMAASPSELRRSPVYARAKLAALSAIKPPAKPLASASAAVKAKYEKALKAHQAKVASARQVAVQLEQYLGKNHGNYEALAFGVAARKLLNGQKIAVLNLGADENEQGGVITLAVDLDAMIADFADLANPAEALRQTFEHEAFHANTFRLARKNPKKYGKEAMRKVWRELPHQLKATVWASYHNARQTAKSKKAFRLPSAFTPDMEYTMAHEHARMLYEKDYCQAITETVDPSSSLVQWVKDLLADLANLLTELMATLKPEQQQFYQELSAQVAELAAFFKEQSATGSPQAIHVIPTVTDHQAVATQALTHFMSAKEGVFQPAALAKIWDLLDPSLQRLVFRSKDRDPVTGRFGTQIASRAPKHELMRDLLAMTATDPKMARAVQEALLKPGTQATKSLNLLERLFTAFSKQTAQEPEPALAASAKQRSTTANNRQPPQTPQSPLLAALAAQSPDARRALATLHSQTLSVLADFIGVRFVVQLPQSPAIQAMLEAEPPQPEDEQKAAAGDQPAQNRLRGRRWLLQQIRIAPGRRLPASPTAAPAPAPGSARQTANRQYVADLLALIQQQEAADLLDTSFTERRAALDAEDAADHGEASTNLAGAKLRAKLRLQQLATVRARFFRQDNAVRELHQAEQSGRQDVEKAAAMAALATGRIGQRRNGAAWRTIGFTERRQLALLGIGVDQSSSGDQGGYPYTLSRRGMAEARVEFSLEGSTERQIAEEELDWMKEQEADYQTAPDDTSPAYVQNSRENWTRSLSTQGTDHILLKQEALDDLALSYPHTAALIRPEHTAREGFGIPSAQTRRPITQDSTPASQSPRSDADRQKQDIPSSEPTHTHTPAPTREESPTFTPLAEGRSPFATERAAPKPVTFDVPIKGSGTITATFPDTASREAFQFKHDLARSRKLPSGPERTKIEQTLSALKARFMADLGLGDAAVTAKLAAYHEHVIKTATEHDANDQIGGITAPQFEAFSGGRAAPSTKSLPPPVGGDLIADLERYGIGRISSTPKPGQGGELDWFKAVTDGTAGPHKQQALILAVKAADAGELSTPLAKRIWIAGTAGLGLTPAQARWERPGHVLAPNGTPTDSAATTLSERQVDGIGTPYQFASADELGNALLAALDARIAAKAQGADPAIDAEASTQEQSRNFATLIDGNTESGKPMTGNAIAAALEPDATENTLKLGTAWFDVIATDDAGVHLTASGPDADLYGSQTIAPDQTVPVTQINDKSLSDSPATRSNVAERSSSDSLAAARAELIAAVEEDTSLGASTRTPAFDRWFGDSKVTDAQGQPLRVYHGTRANFGEFTGSRLFFSDDATAAASYSRLETDETDGSSIFDEQSVIMPAFLSLQNPLIVDAQGLPWHRVPLLIQQQLPGFESPISTNDASVWDTIDGLSKHAETGGFDGLIVRNVRDHNGYANYGTSTTYVAFKPGQIKSVFNQGTWNNRNPNILAASNRTRLAAASYVEEAIKDHSFRSLADLLRFAATDLPAGTFAKLRTPHLYNAWNTVQVENNRPEAARPEEAAALRALAPQVERRFGEMPPDIAAKQESITPESIGIPTLQLAKQAKPVTPTDLLGNPITEQKDEEDEAKPKDKVQNRGSTELQRLQAIDELYGALAPGVEVMETKNQDGDTVPHIMRGRGLMLSVDGQPHVAIRSVALPSVGTGRASGVRFFPFAGDKSNWTGHINKAIQIADPQLDEHTDVYIEPYGGGLVYLQNLEPLLNTNKPILIASSQEFDPDRNLIFNTLKSGDAEAIADMQSFLTDISHKPRTDAGNALFRVIFEKPEDRHLNKATAAAAAQLPRLIALLQRPNVKILPWNDVQTFEKATALARTGKRVTLLEDSNYADLYAEGTQDQYIDIDTHPDMFNAGKITNFIGKDPKKLLAQKLPVYRAVLDAGGTVIATNNMNPDLINGLLAEFGDAGHWFGYAHRTRPVPDGFMRHPDGKGVLWSTERPEYLAILRKGVVNPPQGAPKYGTDTPTGLDYRPGARRSLEGLDRAAQPHRTPSPHTGGSLETAQSLLPQADTIGRGPNNRPRPVGNSAPSTPVIDATLAGGPNWDFTESAEVAAELDADREAANERDREMMAEAGIDDSEEEMTLDEVEAAEKERQRQFYNELGESFDEDGNTLPEALKASARVLPPKPDLANYPTLKGTQEERRAQWDKWHSDVEAWNESVNQFAARQGDLGTFLAAETTNSRGGVYREARVITRVPGSSTDWRTTIFGQQRITPTSTPVGDWANNAWVPIAHDEFPTKGEAYQSAVRGMPEDYTFSSKPLFASNRTVEYVEPGFYSALAEAIRVKMPARSTPATILGILQNAGLKAEEIKWTGVRNWLQAQAQDGPITQQQVLDYLATEGSVKFTITRLSGNDNKDRRRSIEHAINVNPLVRRAMDDEGMSQLDAANLPNRLLDGRQTVSDLPQSLQRYARDLIADHKRLEEMGQEPTPARNTQWTLPGGTNPKEVVVTWKPRGTANTLREIGPQQFELLSHTGRVLTEFRGSREQAEAAANHYENDADRRLLSPNSDSDRTHYGDLDALAWYRTTDRTNAAGPGLLAEEFQSKWHEQGREKGYVEPVDPSKFTASKSPHPRTWNVTYPDGSVHTFGGNSAEEAIGFAVAREQNPAATGRIPAAPYRASWPLMLFKRALLDAVQSGKTWIGWTTGDTQADRYDLSKQVHRIDAKKYDDTRYEIAVLDLRDAEVPLPKESFTAEDLPEIVGKELAERIINDLRYASPSRVINYRGLDLRVGGQGMRKFYDEMLVKEFGKYVKQLGGGTVEKSEVLTPKGNAESAGITEAQEALEQVYKEAAARVTTERQQIARDKGFLEPMIAALEVRNTDEIADQPDVIAARKRLYDEIAKASPTPIHLIRITPQMRSAVEAGQALFAAQRLPLDRALTPTTPGASAAFFRPRNQEPGTRNAPSGQGLTALIPVTPQLLSRAYQSALRGQSSQWLPIKTVWDQFHAQNPAVTPAAFMRSVQEGDDAGTVLLSPPESAATVEAAGPFKLRNASGIVVTEMTLAAAPRRARESMTFDPPFRTAFGDILSYDWMSQPVGGMENQRISDWSAARINPATGREIVHHFKVRKPDGIHTVSLETALGQLSKEQRSKLQGLIKAEQERRQDQSNGQLALFSAHRQFAPAIRFEGRVTAAPGGMHYDALVEQVRRTKLPSWQREQDDSRRLAIRWIRENPSAIETDYTEGFMTPQGFKDRFQALTLARSLGYQGGNDAYGLTSADIQPPSYQGEMALLASADRTTNPSQNESIRGIDTLLQPHAYAPGNTRTNARDRAQSAAAFLTQRNNAGTSEATPPGDRRPWRPTAATQAEWQRLNPDSGPSSIGRNAEEQALVEWAADNGLLLKTLPAQWKFYGPDDVGMMEHHVFQADDELRWIKITSTGSYGIQPFASGDGWKQGVEEATAAKYLQRIINVNAFWGDDQVLHGVWINPKTETAQIIISQPHIAGDTAPTSFIKTQMTDAGFADVGRNGYYRPADNTFVNDIHEGNAILVGDTLTPIDVNVSYPTGTLQTNLERLAKEAPNTASASSLAASDRTPAQTIEATGLAPAISVNGKAYTGRPGMTHGAILGDYVWRKVFTPQQRRDDPNQDNAVNFAHDPWMDTPGSGFDDFGFLDTRTGKLLTREEAYTVLTERGFTPPAGSYSIRYQSLDSSDLFNSTNSGPLPAAARVAQAAAQTNTNPTKPQQDAENYKTGKVDLHGLRLSIENPAGSTRSGVDANGKPWSVPMPHHYGRILGTVGRDKDHLDFFLGPNPDSQLVLIVNQRKPGNGHFDKHKLMLGFNTPAEAAKGYLQSYTPGWKGFQSAVPTTIPVLKHWITTHDTTQPVTKEQIEKLAKTVPLPSSAHDKPAVSIDTTTKPKPAHPPVTHTLPDGYHLTGPGLHTILPASIRAHHGTPHEIDPKTGFSLNKVGTGEGAQVYGWGLYFAEAMNVAEQYRKALSYPIFRIGDKEFFKREGPEAFKKWAISQIGQEWPREVVRYFEHAVDQFYHDSTGYGYSFDAASHRAKSMVRSRLEQNKVEEYRIQEVIDAMGRITDNAIDTTPYDSLEGRWTARAVGWKPSEESFSIDAKAYNDIWSRIGWYAATFAEAPSRLKAEYEAQLDVQSKEYDRLLDAGRTSADPMVVDTSSRVRLAQAALDLLNSGKVVPEANKRRGNLYTVDILGDPAEFLDWDAPLGQQSQSIVAMFQRRAKKPMNSTYKKAFQKIHPFFSGDKRTVREVYNQFTKDIGGEAKDASMFLADMGIKGVRYTDAQSRYRIEQTSHAWEVLTSTGKLVAKEPTEEAARAAMAKLQTYNYVLFDDKLVKIVEQNGKPVSSSPSLPASLRQRATDLDRRLLAVPGASKALDLAGKATDLTGALASKVIKGIVQAPLVPLRVNGYLADALGIQQPFATFGSNNLDQLLADRLGKTSLAGAAAAGTIGALLGGPVGGIAGIAIGGTVGRAFHLQVRSAKAAVETWLDKPEGLAPTIKGLVDQVLPTALIPREWLALHHEMQRKTAYGQETANDLIRALSGNPRLSDLAYPKEFAENPAARAQLFDAMEGRIPMATLPPAMQRLGQRLRDLLRQTGSELVRQGLMNPDTFEELQSNGWMPRYTEDEARESAGSFLAAFKLGVRDLLQQRSTAYHIVDTTRKDKTGQFVTVSRDEGGKRNRWRFRDAASRDAFYHEFVRKQTLDMLQDRSDKTVADMLAPLSRGDKMAMRDQIKSLTADQIANTAKLSPMLAGIVKHAKKHQYDRFAPKDPFEPAKLVKDPVYAVARYTLGQTHNAATMELLRKTATHPEWVSDVAITGFEAIPDANRFGPLAGKHVRKDIAQQILDLVDVPNAALQFYDAILRKWKAGKLVWNPGSHVRDAVGNTMFAFLSGSSIWNPGNWPHYQQAIAALRNGGKDFAELVEMQVIGGDAYTGLVKDRLKGILPDPKTVENYDPGFVQRLMFGFGATLHGSHEFMSSLRRLPDDFFKAAAYFKAKADLQQSPTIANDRQQLQTMAAGHVRKWFPYYDRLGQSGTTRAVGRFVNPFVSFFRESTRILGTAVVERPLALTAALAFPALITAASAIALGLDDDDMEEIQKDMAGKGKLFATGTSLFSMLLPFRSAQGAVQQFDISAIMPFADLLGTRVVVTEADEDPWNRFWRGIVSGGPVLSLVDAWRHNEDAFTRRPIAEFGMTPLEKITAYTKHAAGVALPPLAPGGSAFNTLMRAGDRSTNKTLEKYDPAQAVVRSVVGLNVKNATPDLYRLADDWRKAHGYEVTEGMDYGSTTPASRARKQLFTLLAQDEPNPAAIKNTLQKLQEMGHPVRTEQDINRLLFYRDPAKLIGGNKAKGITPQDAQAQFRASLQGEARAAFERALQEFRRIQQKAPLLVRQASRL